MPFIGPGPYDLRDAENADGIEESSHKKQNSQFNGMPRNVSKFG